jgi:uroporphyrinogen decarboxylase
MEKTKEVKRCRQFNATLPGMKASTLDAVSNSTPRRDECVGVWKNCLPPVGLTNRERFLNACLSRPVDHPPIWLMRQAGRVLPEYRALKEKYSFLELVQTPELAAEVTLQPIRRFDFDAAILFSDILVVAEALGQAYRFRETGGVEMAFSLASAEDIDRLNPALIRERLAYVSHAIPMIKQQLGGRTALIGFAGSPWTLANFMMEGGSAKEHAKAKMLFYSNPRLFSKFLEKLTVAVTEFLQLQIDAGVDAIQIFDSLGGVLSENIYAPASARWITNIIAALEGQVPVIVFAKGANGSWDALRKTKPNVLSVDWTVRLAEVRKFLPEAIGLQGNLDPMVLNTTPKIVAQETRCLLAEMRGRNGYIVNLGHGVPPTAKLENIEALVTTVRNPQ